MHLSFGKTHIYLKLVQHFLKQRNQRRDHVQGGVPFVKASQRRSVAGRRRRPVPRVAAAVAPSRAGT